MAKGPNASARKKAASSKAAKATTDKVEDAVVVEELPPVEPKKPEASAKSEPRGKAEAKKDTPPEPDQEPKSDDVTTPQDEVKPSTTGAPPAPVSKKQTGGVFVGFFLGGVAAAAIGFGAGWYLFGRENSLEPSVTAHGQAISGLTDEANALSGRISALEGDTAVSDLQGELTTRLDGLTARLTETADRLLAIETRLAAVEKLAPEGSAAAQMAAEAYERELSALREMFADELAKLEAAQTDAATLEMQAVEAGQAAAGRAALARITAAVDTGGPYDGALAELTEATGLDVPAGLAAQAADGVPTLSALQDAFPPAARAALDASIRAGVESGEVSRFTAFLQTQLGTRSLKAKEGDDADAVLSRVEAALHQGELNTALSELEALPMPGQPAMADWRAMAETRKAALDALAVLAENLNAQ